MKSKYIQVLILLLLIIPASAQNTLTGKITDWKTGEPLIGVVVALHDLKMGAVTDTNGIYVITRLPKGNFFVDVSYPSYAGKAIAVDINGYTVKNILLEASITELHEVVVTGVSSATEQHANPVPVAVVNKTQLLQQTSTNIIEAISRQPGLSQIATGPAISKPNIRGLGYNRVVTLNNGVRQEGQQWGDEHGVEMDEYSVERVEIIKGPGSLMYGSDALAGVINMITASPLPEGKINGGVLTNFQTNNSMLGYSLMNTGNLRGISWQLRYSNKFAGNYHNTYDGTVYNSGFRETDLNGYIGVNRKWGYSQLYFASFDQTIAMTEGKRDSLGNFMKALTPDSAVTVGQADLERFAIGIPNQRVQHLRFISANQFILGKSRLTATLGYQVSKRKEFGDPEHPNAYGLFFYMPTLTYDLKFFMPEQSGWKVSYGLGGMYQQNTNKGIEFLIPAYGLFDIGAFTFAQKKLRKLNLAGGLRYDRRMVSSNGLYLDSLGEPVPAGVLKFAAIHTSFQNFSASAGATFEASANTILKLNIARGYRAPNIAELASNGRHEGSYRYEYGNGSLRPETSLQVDAGIELNSKHVTFEAGAFSNSIQNYIYASRLSGVNGGDSIADPLEPVPAYQYGQGSAWLFGGEAGIDIHPHPLDWLHWQSSFSVVRGRQLGQNDSAKYLPFIPAPRILTELKGNIKKKGKYLRNAFIKCDMDYYFAQNQYLKAGNTETATPAYTLVHGGIGTDVVNAKGNKIFTLLISVNNLFDVGYQNNLSRFKYLPVNPLSGRTGVYNMGRNVSFKLVIPFCFR